MSEEIKPGDTVRLKSGSNAMTVGQITIVAEVEYFDHNTGKIMGATVALNSLEKQPEQGT